MEATNCNIKRFFNTVILAFSQPFYNTFLNIHSNDQTSQKCHEPQKISWNFSPKCHESMTFQFLEYIVFTCEARKQKRQSLSRSPKPPGYSCPARSQSREPETSRSQFRPHHAPLKITRLQIPVA